MRGVREMATSALVLLAAVIGVACTEDPIDTFGIVQSVGRSEVCLLASDSGDRICIDDVKLLGRSGETFAVGDCVRLRQVPEASGSATLTVQPAKDCLRGS